jgi:hypothetical protein
MWGCVIRADERAVTDTSRNTPSSLGAPPRGSRRVRHDAQRLAPAV